MAGWGVGEHKTRSPTDITAQVRSLTALTDHAKDTPPSTARPTCELRGSQEATARDNDTKNLSSHQASPEPLKQKVVVLRKSTVQLHDQLRESKGRPTRREENSPVIRTACEATTDFVFASPTSNTAMGIASRPVLQKSHSVAFGVDSTVPEGNGYNHHLLMPPPLLQPATFVMPTTLGAASRVPTTIPPLVSVSTAPEYTLGTLDLRHQDSLGFTAGPSSDLRLLRRSESLGFDLDSSSKMSSQSLTPEAAGATPGGQVIHPGNGKDSRRALGGKWRTSRRAAFRNRPLCRADSRTVTVSFGSDHAGDRVKGVAGTVCAESDSTWMDDRSAATIISNHDRTTTEGVATVTGNHDRTTMEGATTITGNHDRTTMEGAATITGNHDRTTMEGASIITGNHDRTTMEGAASTTSNHGDTRMEASRTAPSRTCQDSSEPCSPRPVPPPVRRQLSRRRNHQQATATSPTPAGSEPGVGDGDEQGNGDYDDPEERVREEGDKESSLSFTPPGSPHPKERRMDMNK